MQLNVKVMLHDFLSLPIAYNHILQSAIYELGKSDNSGYALNIHNEKKDGENQKFRFMCFSLINGKHKVTNGRIIFYDEIQFEVRSICSSWIQAIESNLKQNGIRFGDVIYNDINTEISDVYIHQSELLVQMISPITVHMADRLTGKTVYYSPLDNEFERLININFKNKYRQYYGIESMEDIHISIVDVSPKDRLVTRYKGSYYITGWNGVYRIMASPKALSFLYDVGIGTRNSQGFGMMQII